MSDTAELHRLLTPDEFLEFIDKRDPSEKWALLEGRPLMMIGGTHRHSLIAGNIFNALFQMARPRGLEAHASDLLVTSPVQDHFAAAPDVFIRRGRVEPTARRVDDPLLVVEVLSPSTMASDRGYKFSCYTTIPSLQQILFVYADEARVENWTRAEPEWNLEIVNGDDGTVRLLPLDDGTLALAAIYANTGLTR